MGVSDDRLNNSRKIRSAQKVGPPVIVHDIGQKRNDKVHYIDMKNGQEHPSKST